MRLENKVVLITGGTSGIGKTTVELFAAEGAQVAFTGRRKQLGEEVAGKTGAYFIQADHRFMEDCQRSVSETVAKYGRIDVLFNNAGIVVSGTAESTNDEDWNETLSGKVDFLITGDKQHFGKMKELDKYPFHVVTPPDFIDSILPGILK